MNTTLRTALLKEHVRERRLTFLNYAWMWIAFGAVLYFAWPYLSEALKTLEDTSPYYRYVVPAGLLLWIGYGIADVVKVSRRAKRIEEVCQKLGQGAKATNIYENRDHKIKLPLFKFNIHLCPVDYFMFSLDCDPTRQYHLPVPHSYISDLKNVLSGVSLEKVYDHLEDIYSNEEIEYNPADDTPLKTMEEFKSFLTTQLAGDVESLENKRKSSHRTASIGKLMGGVIMLGVIGIIAWYVYSNGMDFTSGNTHQIYFIYGGGIAVFYLFYFLFMRPRQLKNATGPQTAPAYTSTDFQFKDGIMQKMVKFISPQADYVMHGHISPEELMASGMFQEARYDITGNDLIIGKYRGVPFQFCDLLVRVTPKVTYQDEEPDTAFYGQYFVARFNKSFTTPVYLIPRKGMLGFKGNDISSYTYHEGEKVELEDPEFMKMFKVYAGDQIEARYILTTAMMERIKELAKRTQGDYFIAFYNNKITIANNSGKNNFEIKENKSILKDDYKVLTDFYGELCDQFAMIDDLKLNIKIWR